MYVSNVLARAEADGKVSTKAATQIAALKAAVAQEDKDLKLSQKSLLTDDIAEADHDRDLLLGGYKQAVRGFLNLPVESAGGKGAEPAHHRLRHRPAGAA